MDSIYTNRNSKKDFVYNGINENTENEMDIFIASAFFTESNVIKDLLEKKCNIRIIVRLGFPTSPTALDYLLKQNVQARYYTNQTFHPKLYIFGDKYALIGSANLTGSALRVNQEVVVGLDSSDERFRELTELFSEYWEEAKVLNAESIAAYRKIFEQYKSAAELVEKLDNEVIDKIGDYNFSNIDRGIKKTNKQEIYIDTYSKSYQETVSAFNKIQAIYINKSRKISEDKIPLRLEIDSFFSFVRDHHASHETWKNQPLGWSANNQQLLNNLIDEWLSIEWLHFEDRIVNYNYPLITSVFASEASIDKATGEEIVEALTSLHSFYECLRFHKGGLEALKFNFLEANDIKQIKKSFKHLLFGKGDIVKRMADLIYNNQSYKLTYFADAGVQELVGWVNKEDLPVINGRTTKVLRYFGFNVKQM